MHCPTPCPCPHPPERTAAELMALSRLDEQEEKRREVAFSVLMCSLAILRWGAWREGTSMPTHLRATRSSPRGAAYVYHNVFPHLRFYRTPLLRKG